MHYTYLLFSEDLNIFYKGYSTEPNKRLSNHLSTTTKFTARTKDWKLVYVKQHDDKNAALKHEKMLKRQNHNHLNWIITHPENIVSEFLLDMD